MHAFARSRGGIMADLPVHSTMLSANLFFGLPLPRLHSIVSRSITDFGYIGRQLVVFQFASLYSFHETFVRSYASWCFPAHAELVSDSVFVGDDLAEASQLYRLESLLCRSDMTPID